MDKEKMLNERENPFCIISKKFFGEYLIRDIQTNSSWSTNPDSDAYVVVPDNLVQGLLSTKGFCDIELNEDGTEVISFTPKEIPEILEPRALPSAEERLTALENAMLEILGVNLE